MLKKLQKFCEQNTFFSRYLDRFLGLGLFFQSLLIFYLFLLHLNFGFFGLYPLWLSPLLLLGIFALGTTLYTLLTTRALNKKTLKGKKEKRPATNILQMLAIIMSTMSILVTAAIAYSLLNEQPPKFFPFDDPQAQYTVTKRGKNYFVRYQSVGDMNTKTFCGQHRGRVVCRNRVDDDIEVMVGKSPVDLAPLVGKSVQLEGIFRYSDKQCILDSCHDIGRWAVLHIRNLQLSQ